MEVFFHMDISHFPHFLCQLGLQFGMYQMSYSPKVNCTSFWGANPAHLCDNDCTLATMK